MVYQQEFQKGGMEDLSIFLEFDHHPEIRIEEVFKIRQAFAERNEQIGDIEISVGDFMEMKMKIKDL